GLAGAFFLGLISKSSSSAFFFLAPFSPGAAPSLRERLVLTVDSSVVFSSHSLHCSFQASSNSLRSALQRSLGDLLRSASISSLRCLTAALSLSTRSLVRAQSAMPRR